jgi:hypothetical protein
MTKFATVLTTVILVASCSDNLTLPPEREPYQASAPQELECVPNLDEKVTGEELPVGFDVPVSYRINPADQTREVDLVGLVDQEGVRVWDFSADHPDDQELTIQATTPTERWYADAFPDGEFVAPLDAAGRLEGVYRRTEAGVFLLGYASVEEQPEQGQTLVTYTEPVAIYRFPLEVGAEWVSTGEVRNAVVQDLPYAGRDIYAIKVDAIGELWLPDLQFDRVHRVRTDLTIEPSAGEGVTRKQVSFVFECFGEVARVVSSDGETKKNFDTAVELRRFGL